MIPAWHRQKAGGPQLGARRDGEPGPFGIRIAEDDSDEDQADEDDGDGLDGEQHDGVTAMRRELNPSGSSRNGAKMAGQTP